MVDLTILKEEINETNVTESLTMQSYSLEAELYNDDVTISRAEIALANYNNIAYNLESDAIDNSITSKSFHWANLNTVLVDESIGITDVTDIQSMESFSDETPNESEITITLEGLVDKGIELWKVIVKKITEYYRNLKSWILGYFNKQKVAEKSNNAVEETVNKSSIKNELSITIPATLARNLNIDNNSSINQINKNISKTLEEIKKLSALTYTDNFLDAYEKALSEVDVSSLSDTVTSHKNVTNDDSLRLGTLKSNLGDSIKSNNGTMVKNYYITGIESYVDTTVSTINNASVENSIVKSISISIRKNKDNKVKDDVTLIVPDKSSLQTTLDLLSSPDFKNISLTTDEIKQIFKRKDNILYHGNELVTKLQQIKSKTKKELKAKIELNQFVRSSSENSKLVGGHRLLAATAIFKYYIDLSTLVSKISKDLT